MASQAYVERIFAVCGLLTMHQGTAINHINKTLEMRMCHKLNRKMLWDSGFAYRVLASLTTQTVLCCDICGTVCEPARLVDSHIKQNQMVFDSIFMYKKDTHKTKMTVFDKTIIK